MPARKKQPALAKQLLLTDAADTVDTAYWSVSEALDWLKQAIDQHPVLGQTVTVRGELSNVRPASSGHVYATLKDDNASLNVVLWRSTVQKLAFRLEDGMAVFATGQFNVYAPGGSVSMVVQRVAPDGVGALQLAFEQLKTMLTAEGVFDEARKQPLPGFPLRIGIVTSATGAVIHDMWRVIQQKNPLVTAVVAPVPVQGEGAAQQIADAIDRLNDPRLALDALIVARGGGSFEDLFCFSEAVVVRAIAQSVLPVVTGIGHQPDFSLADAAADYSAATPTAAADALVADAMAWQAWLVQQQTLLQREITQRLASDAQRLDQLTDRLQHDFAQQTHQADVQLRYTQQALQRAMEHRMEQTGQQLAQQVALLEQLSPLSTLARGYSVVQTLDKRLIQSVDQLVVGEPLHATFQDGAAVVVVKDIHRTRIAGFE
jgi:exodeoxyribonuclease VII large subunit